MWQLTVGLTGNRLAILQRLPSVVLCPIALETASARNRYINFALLWKAFRKK